jgi:hypothetical protein
MVQLAAMSAMGDQGAMMQMQAIAQDIARAQAEDNLVERAGKTLSILYAYQVDQQPQPFKMALKAAVRRAKVNGVAWVKLNFLRETETRPEAALRYEDSSAKLAMIERKLAEAQEQPEQDGEDLEAERAELQQLLADIEAQPDRVVREQIAFDFPKSGEIILDPKTRHLKTLAGCQWLAHKFALTCEEIEDIYGVDISDQMSGPKHDAYEAMDADPEERSYCVYEVQDKRRQQVCVIVEGYDRFLRPPAEPDIWFERFFNVWPLVFNEIEHDEEIYPPSDVWNARHMQFEYNRSRNALREHRIAARPFWVAAAGRLEASEKERLKNHAAHEIVEINPMDPKQPISAAVERGPTAPIDPNLYEVETMHSDMLRTVGSQEANLGGTSNATATESSIAESSRMSSLSDNADDLDDLLTELARAGGQVLLQQMSKERVVEIVGPGAVWPELPVSRRALADEITLAVKAGSSGRPNQAAELAKLERAWPALSAMPGVNPEPLGKKYADLVDIDSEELLKQGALSIVAQNQLAGAAAPPATSEPTAQGGQGGDNAPKPDPGSGGAQPGYPAGGGPGLV